MKLSIIIPILNEVELVSSQLRVLQFARHRGHELIVADGGSEDGSIKSASSLADKVCECDRGRARQMNEGARLAKGDVLLFLHVDTILPMDFDHLIKSLLFDTERQWGRFDVQLNDSQWIFSVIAFAMNLRSRLTGVVTGDQAIFVRKAFFQRQGGFAEIPLMEDIELSKRFRNKSWPVRIKQPVVTSSRRWRKDGVLRTVMTMWWLRLCFFCGVNPEKLSTIYYKNKS